MISNNRKITTSLCPVCYERVPAVIEIEGGVVWMVKTCRKHGTFRAIVERDARWWAWCQQIGHTNIYNGYFVDVTNKCNLRCKYCYHTRGGEHRGVDDIMKEVIGVKKLAPFYVTGGEPTLHPNLVEILEKMVKIGETWVLTNGVVLAEDPFLLEKIVGMGVKIMLSFHKESQGADVKLLEQMWEKGMVLDSSAWVIDKVEQIDEALKVYGDFAPVLQDMRIKAATNLWKEGRAGNKIFVSDMINYLSEKYEVAFNTNEANKTSYCPITLDGVLNVKLVSWYDVGNVDLWDINCPPLYKAGDGSVNNMVTTCLTNEGLVEKKKEIRIRRGYVCDVVELGKMWRDLVLETVPGSNPNMEWWVEGTLRLLGNPDYHLTVAESKGKLIGFMDGMFIQDPVRGEVVAQGRHMYVKPEYRNKNLAGLIHKRGIRDGEDRGVFVHKYSVREGEKHLWEGIGCQPVETIYEEDRREG